MTLSDLASELRAAFPGLRALVDDDALVVTWQGATVWMDAAEAGALLRWSGAPESAVLEAMRLLAQRVRA